MSSPERWSYSWRICSLVQPRPKRSTTNSTAMRVPLITGLPTSTFGSTLMRCCQSIVFMRPLYHGAAPMRTLAAAIAFVLIPAVASAQPSPGNRLAYLDEVDPYYPHAKFPKLITPQWVGEPGVEAVVILAIDDMRDTKRYEVFLRPLLRRLKE